MRVKGTLRRIVKSFKKPSPEKIKSVSKKITSGYANNMREHRNIVDRKNAAHFTNNKISNSKKRAKNSKRIETASNSMLAKNKNRTAQIDRRLDTVTSSNIKKHRNRNLGKLALAVGATGVTGLAVKKTQENKTLKNRVKSKLGM